MAIFTAIATAIVSAIGISTATIIGTLTWASLATGIIATGLALGTAKLLGVFNVPKMDMKDPGVKIQLPPSTDNKVPRLYGRNFTGSIIIDAEIKNQNKTMAYAMVISEHSPNDTWSINKIYRGDTELVFGSGANAHVVQSIIDPNATASTVVTGKMRCRVYAGGSGSAKQIFPVPGGSVTAANAYGLGSGQFSNWTSANTMDGLVFAIFEIDYDQENGLLGLDNITFDINNALNEPSNVLLDYLRNERYGAGISNTMIDTTSFNDWFTYANTQVNYTDSSNVTQQHSRYQIDGALSTFNTCKQSIDKICQAGGAFFTYNPKKGQFGVVVNRAATAGELANAFVLNDDNIIGKIQITSTDLFSLFNQIEVEYASVNQKDQTDVYFAEANVNIRNPNEPDNKLQYRLDMVNDRTRVAQLANIDLNQSRISTVINLTADFSAMQVDVGDVVKLTVPLYGYTNKLFRVMRTTEVEDADGMITIKLVLLEYDADVYGDLLTQEDLPGPVTGITNWWVLNSNAVLTIGNITIVDDPTGSNAEQYNATTGSFVGNISLATAKSQFGSFYANSTFINVPIKPPVNTNYNFARVAVVNSTGNATPVVYTQTPTAVTSTNGYFTDDEFYNFSIGTASLVKDAPIYLEIQMQDTGSGAASRTFTTATLNILPVNTVDGNTDIKPGTVTGNVIAPNTITANNFIIFAPGAQIQEGGLANTSLPGNVVYRKLITPVEYDLRGLEANVDYSIDAVAEVVGSLPPVSGSGGGYTIAFRTKANVTYKYSGNSSTYTYDYTPASSVLNLDDPYPPTAFIPAGGVITLNPAEFFPGDANGTLVSANIWLEGYNTMGNAIAGRGFEGMKYQFLKLNKGKK
jgi:hypothetical protein